jgi:putative cell wall-binding protein
MLSIATATVIVAMTSVSSFAETKTDVVDGDRQDISLELNKSVFKKADEVILVNENATVDSISATSLAYARKAPILLSSKRNLGRATRSYIESLGAKKVTIIGGSDVISKETENNLIRMGIEVDRMMGQTRYDTSLNIARTFYRDYGFDKAFLVSSSVGIENAMSVYAYAAKNNIPLIWCKKENTDDVLEYLKGKDLSNVYLVGERNDFPDNVEKNNKNVEVIDKINKARSNIATLRKFYKPEDFNKIYMTKVNYGSANTAQEFISLGVVAAYNNMPILISDEDMSYEQKKFLQTEHVNTVVQVGGKIQPYSTLNLLTSRTVMSSIILTFILIGVVYRCMRYGI